MNRVISTLRSACAFVLFVLVFVAVAIVCKDEPQWRRA